MANAEHCVGFNSMEWTPVELERRSEVQNDLVETLLDDK